jgi:hypothetical protein
MFRLLWFSKLLGLRSRSIRRRQAAQHRRYVRLQLEGLEERVTPSSLPFATAANASELQQNIAFVNSNTSQAWTFNLQANTTFNLTAQQELTAGANVKIVGLGGDVITPEAGIRAFKVDTGATAEFDNLSISGGKISATGDRLLGDILAGGAGLWVAGGAVTLSGVSVTNNTVFAGAGGTFPVPVGGGIFVEGSASKLTIANSHIDDNQALGVLADGVTQALFSDADGGGIFIDGGVINISDSTISNNKAVAGSGLFAAGGGMDIEVATSALLTNLTVDGNVAQGGSGTSHGGAVDGGAFVFGGTGPIQLVGSTVSNNRAIGGNAATNNSNDTGGDASGGGLFTSGGAGAVTVLNSSFISNTAQGGDGVKGGFAEGGAIDNYFGLVNLFNTTLGQNTAQGGNGTTGAQGSGFGGGLAAGNTGFGDSGTIQQLFNNTIVFNQALNGTGTPAPGGGGGIWSITAGATNIASALNNLVQGNTTNSVGPEVNIAGSSTTTLPGGGPNIIGGPIQIAPTLTTNPGIPLPFYPLLRNATLAIKTGDTSVVSAIANAENTTPDKATDEIGHPRTTGNGSQIDIGAVQFFPHPATVAADPVTAIASTAPQLVTVSATVTSPDDTVNEGIVTFTVFFKSSNQQVSESAQAAVHNGLASTALVVPGGTPVGSYTIQAVYSDATNNFVADLPSTTTLTILAPTSVSVGSLKSIPAHKKDQSVDVSATVSSPNGPVNHGTVTFALFDSNNVQVGLPVVANVMSNGTASATLVVLGGTPPGDYTVKAIYTDNQGVFADSSDSQPLTLKGGGKKK